MLQRNVPQALALALLCALVPAAPAQQAATPAVVLRLRSLEGLADDFKYLARLAGPDADNQLAQLDGFLKATRLFDALDPKRPLGIYGSIDANVITSTGVIMLPVKSEKALLDLLQGFNIEASKGTDDIYTVNAPNVPVPIYARFANQYAYVTGQNKAALDKGKLLAPAVVFPAGETAALSASFRIDQVPDELKQIALGQLELRLADLQDQDLPNETPVQRRLRIETTKFLSTQISAVIKDGGTLTVRLDLDRARDEVNAELSLTARPNSPLAANIAALGQSTSLFAGVIGSKSAMNGLVRFSLPADVRKTLEPVIDEAFQAAVKQEKDPVRKAEAERLFKAVAPSLKAGELDGGFTLRGPGSNKLYTFVAGVRLKDGTSIDKALRQALKDLPAKERALVQLDADSAAGVAIHRIQLKDADADFQKSFGAGPAYVAFRADAGFIAVGDEGLSALKEALAAKPKNSPQLHLDMSLRQLAPLMEAENPGATQAAQTAFGSTAGNDRLVLTLEGGQSLRARLQIKTPALKFLQLLERERN